MPPYPIEIINFGNPEFKLHLAIIAELNTIQGDIIYLTPPTRHLLWAAPYEREDYKTSFIWEKLREYRTTCKGFHPFILAIVHGSLASDKLGNLFGSRSEEDNFAVVTTRDWERYFAPPSLSVYLMYYFIRYAISFICPEIRSHEDTRNCFFDKKINKPDIKLSMASGRICDNCRTVIEKWIDGHTYSSVLKLVQQLRAKVNSAHPVQKKKPRVFIGSSSEGLGIAEHLQLGLSHSTEATIWSQGVFGLSKGNLENLVKAASDFDFAILVLTPDDLTTKRGKTENSPRDNVLFETGLFMGALGREKTFMVYCRDEAIDLPTDLAGVSAATFARRSDDNMTAALGPVCTALKRAMGIY
jgi:predicted nucleotide-binding protein